MDKKRALKVCWRFELELSLLTIKNYQVIKGEKGDSKPKRLKILFQLK